MTAHVPLDLPAGERGVASQALADLLAGADPTAPPSEAAVLAALAAPLAPYFDRREARRREEHARAQYQRGLSLLRIRMPLQSTADERIEAEATLRTRLRESPDADPQECAAEIGSRVCASVERRLRAAEASERESRATEDRIRETRDRLRSGIHHGATAAEREEASALLEQRLREEPARTPMEIVAPILNSLRAKVEKREEDAHRAEMKAIRDRQESAERERRRDTWQREAEARFSKLFREAIEEEREALREEEEEGDLDATCEKYQFELHFQTEYALLPKFRESLSKLRVGDDVDEAAAKIIESQFAAVWEKARRGADRE
jgi:hypothetical protein